MNEPLVTPKELFDRANDYDAKHEYIDGHLLKLAGQEIERLQSLLTKAQLSINFWMAAKDKAEKEGEREVEALRAEKRTLERLLRDAKIEEPK